MGSRKGKFVPLSYNKVVEAVSIVDREREFDLRRRRRLSGWVGICGRLELKANLRAPALTLVNSALNHPTVVFRDPVSEEGIWYADHERVRVEAIDFDRVEPGLETLRLDERTYGRQTVLPNVGWCIRQRGIPDQKASAKSCPI